MKVEKVEKIHKEYVVTEVCCEKMKSHIDPHPQYDGNITCEDGKIAFCGWYIDYCPFCGKKIEQRSCFKEVCPNGKGAVLKTV